MVNEYQSCVTAFYADFNPVNAVTCVFGIKLGLPLFYAIMMCMLLTLTWNRNQNVAGTLVVMLLFLNHAVLPAEFASTFWKIFLLFGIVGVLYKAVKG